MSVRNFTQIETTNQINDKCTVAPSAHCAHIDRKKFWLSPEIRCCTINRVHIEIRMGERYYFILPKLILFLPWQGNKNAIFHAKLTRNNNNGKNQIMQCFKFPIQHVCGRLLMWKFRKEKRKYSSARLWIGAFFYNSRKYLNYSIVSVTTEKENVGAASIHDFRSSVYIFWFSWRCVTYFDPTTWVHM